MKLKKKLKLEAIQDSDNIAKLLPEDDLDEIGRSVVQEYEIDEASRKRWMTKMQDATDLALQLVEPKSYPWPKAANIKFPLLTVAALQFASRAYPALVKAPDLVKYRVQGQDPDGAKASRASRISSHMSYQLLEQDEAWEEGQDRGFVALPILGCIFKKSYFDPVKEHNRSTLVLPKNLCVHYYARSIEEAERKTEIFELYQREIRERELRGIFTEHEYGPPPAPAERAEDERQGLSAPLGDEDSPRVFLEQHRYLDLDGDGYKEPYVVTVEKESRKVARIVARIKEVITEQSVAIEELQKRMKALAEGVQQPQQGGQPSMQQVAQLQQVELAINNMNAQIEELAAQKPVILRIVPVEHYTKYSFIPSPDGGFYDLGFGALLSPINDSVNTIINQLVDSGTLQNGSMGFIGKGARIKGGKVRFSPFEWKRVDVAGATLRDSLVPLPVSPPSNVLFQLLGLLISYAERVGSVTETMMGDNPGQNTPAYNMSAMLEQGLQVFNGIFKRVYRSFRGELRKLYDLNSIYLDKEEYFTYQDSSSEALRVDYTADPKDLIPAADPNAFSSKEKLAKAQAIREASMMAPGYDKMKVEQRFLEALDIPDAAEIYPTQQNPETGAVELVFPPQPDPEFEIKRAEEQRRALEGKTRSEVTMVEAEAKLMVAEAEIILKQAQARKLGEDVELKKLEILQKDMEGKRKALLEMAKLESANANRGTDGGSNS
jgi:chaperonin GroES